MNFEQATIALDTLTQALKNGEQHGIMRDTEVLKLTEDNARLSTALEYKSEELDKTVTKLIDTDANLCTEIRSNGELKATLKQLLAEQMALASRAADMLMSLEAKPVPVLTPETIKMEKPKLSEFLVKAHERNKDRDEQLRDERLLELHVETTLNDIAKVPTGEEFILDAPYGERITDWLLKKWYRRILGKAPGNFKDAPSIKLRKEEHGAWTFIGQAPKLTNTIEKEDREPIPFRAKETNDQSNGETPNPFADNGEDVPGFLKQGPKYDADQGRKPNDF